MSYRVRNRSETQTHHFETYLSKHFWSALAPFYKTLLLTVCTAHVPVTLLILKDKMADASNSPEWPILVKGWWRLGKSHKKHLMDFCWGGGCAFLYYVFVNDTSAHCFMFPKSKIFVTFVLYGSSVCHLLWTIFFA